MIKQAVISIRNYDLGKVSPYIRTRNGHLVGPFRSIERLLWKGHKKALAALMIYTAHVSSSLTKKQREKWTSSVTSSKPDIQWEWEESFIPRLTHLTGPLTINGVRGTYVDQTSWSTSKRAPTHTGKTVPESETHTQLESFSLTRFA
jgi:hypothetical protein